jgi:hypothetical protein
MGLTGLSDSSGRRLSRTQILNTFKAELREYRTLQVRALVGLQPWTRRATGLLWTVLAGRICVVVTWWNMPTHAHAPTQNRRCEQEELSTWTAAFCEKNKRKPSLVDVQRTGVDLQTPARLCLKCVALPGTPWCI